MMNQQINQASYDPNRLLDKLTADLHLNNDRELAHELRISFKLIGKIRSGDVAISPSMLLWMAECAQTSINELRSTLGDKRARARIRLAKAA